MGGRAVLLKVELCSASHGVNESHSDIKAGVREGTKWREARYS